MSDPAHIARINLLLLVFALPTAVLATSTALPCERKYAVLHGWDLLSATTADVYRNRAKFAATGADGIAMPVDGVDAKGKPIRGRYVMNGKDWSEATFAQTRKMLTEMSKLKGLRDSFALMFWSPPTRLAWTNDVDWARFAKNAALIARTAKAAGMKGLLIDHEDYCKTQQFRCGAPDGEFDLVWGVARRRGAQVFKAMLDEFPDARFLSFWFFSEPLKVIRSCRAGDGCRADGNLWIAFLNGAIDVMTPEAKFIDGGERHGYKAVADEDGFRLAYWTTACGTLPLVSRENRAKYREALSVGIAQYVDKYLSDFEWAFKPVGTSMVARCADNLFQAGAICDECVWLYGENGTWIDWDDKRHRDRKRPTWESQIPGLARIVRLSVGDFSDVRREAMAGVLTNVVSNPDCNPSAKGGVPAPFAVCKEEPWATDEMFFYDDKVGASRSGSLRFGGGGAFTFKASQPLVAGQVVYASVKAKGEHPLVNVTWCKGGRWFWKSDCHFLATASAVDKRGWKHLEGCFTVPQGADSVGLIISGAASLKNPIYYDDINVFVAPAFDK